MSQAQQLWIAAEANLYLQALDSTGTPTGAKTRIERVEDVKVSPVLHNTTVEEPGYGSQQKFTFVVGHVITIGPHDLRDIDAQIKVFESDTTAPWRLLVQNTNPRYDGSGPAHNETRDFRFVTLESGPDQQWKNQRDKQVVSVALHAETEIPYVLGS